MNSRVIQIEKYMKIAITEAKQSLREGNHGFGALIIKDKTILAQAHDTEETDRDPTLHAEINVIRKASARLGKDLSGCILISTHEPCPMCAGAIIWACIPHIVYGYGIADAVRQGRSRIEITAEELFQKAKANIRVDTGILQKECAVLYNQKVRTELEILRGATNEELKSYNQCSITERLKWFHKEKPYLTFGEVDVLDQGYRLLLHKLGISEAEAPIVNRERKRLVFHSQNFCPTLEACKILRLDTRKICRLYNEGATDRLIRQIDPKLHFSRNYDKIRPYSDYCEERIEYW